MVVDRFQGLMKQWKQTFAGYIARQTFDRHVFMSGRKGDLGQVFKHLTTKFCARRQNFMTCFSGLSRLGNYGWNQF